MLKDITDSGHFYTKNQVEWFRYLTCPKCCNEYYHAFRCPESKLDWDLELENMREET